MSTCKWCEEDKENLFFRDYPYEEGEYCEECTKELDNWPKGKWETFYDELQEALEHYHDLYDIPFEEKIKRQSQDSYGVSDICGKNRSYGNCTCV
ncbi:hypothetical protein [Virgibacillus sediminis]|uniref:Uncharacterized protein n=1 Tax=Virgibacillus sediminis TaxID=202260 RepID=A0ABV7A3Q3_9BACI